MKKVFCWLSDHKWYTSYIGQPGQYPDFRECTRCGKREYYDDKTNTFK